MKASEIVKANPNREDFERAVLAARDNWHLWPMIEVPVGVSPHRASIFVAADYFTIGEEGDRMRCPLSGPGAQAVADATQMMLPTPKMVDAIWRAARTKLVPITGGEVGIRIATEDQCSPRAFAAHDVAIARQLHLRPDPDVPGLVAGHKKDVVLTNRLTREFRAATGFGGPSQVAIYGWHRPGGVPIQPLSTVHEARYSDYSHGVRLVSPTMMLDGQPVPVADVLASSLHAGLLSYEGVLTALRLPSEPPATPPRAAHPSEQPRTLRVGSRGTDVERLQRALGVVPADGLYGPRTGAAVRAWQAARGLDADGIFGPASWVALAHAAPTEPPPPPTPRNDVPVVGDEPDVPFVEARNFTRVPAGTPRKVDWVVIHSMEMPEKGSTAEACARMFASTDRLASAHYCVDADSTVQCVRERDVAFAAPGANRAGVQVEHAGYARQTAGEWGDAFSAAMLDRSAALVARVCTRHDVPVVFVDAEDLLAGERGVTTHAEVSRACYLAHRRGLASSPFARAKTDHSDPGVGFPMDAYLQKVREKLT